MKKIKVCHMTSVHSPEDGRIFRKECISLANAGYDTYLIQQGDTYEKNGVHIIGFGKPESKRLKRMINSTSKVYKLALKVNADIYHFHDPELLPVGYKLKKKGKKVIFDSHENTAQSIKDKDYIPKVIRNSAFILYSAYEKFICKKLDAVIYVTPNLKSTFAKLNKHIVMITNYPILDDFITPSYSNNRLFFAGVIISQWHHDEILEAMKDIDNVDYTLCGPVSEGYISHLKNHKSWNKVRYLGKVPNEQVRIEMSESSIGLALLQPDNNTSGWTGTLGNTKLFEEMMAGLPIICTRFDLWKDIIEKNNCGFCVSPNNVKEIKKAIQTLITNKSLSRQMGQNGRKLVEKSYNWSVEEKKLLSLYGYISKRI